MAVRSTSKQDRSAPGLVGPTEEEQEAEIR